jgi:CubicO group peptidase (beta-lactamase class C family)
LLQSAKTIVDLGLMRGSPAPPERLVTSRNWLDGPFNRWGFLHVRELTRTARIARGHGPVRALPAAPLPLGGVSFAWEGERVTVEDALRAAYADGVCVVHDGNLVFEYYADGVRPDDPHLLMSVSKSLTATLIGVLVGEGVLDPADAVTAHVPALRGTAWDGCTLQHCLDMRAGTRFDEDDYADPRSDGVLLDQVSGYRTRTTEGLPHDTYAWIGGLDNDREHGSAFKYRSILTDVLGWVAAGATGERFPDLFADRVWSRIGAEHDADLIVDDAGSPEVEGGMCVTPRDLARFGLPWLEEGTVEGRRVVPASWLARVRQRDEDLVAAFADARRDDPSVLLYHDCWWVIDPDAGVWCGRGINGQRLLVHRPSRTVIAAVSAWPDKMDDRLSRLMDATHEAITTHLAARRR